MQQEASLKRTYLRQVKKHLTCSPKERNRFLHRTEQMLDAFLEENPDATEEDLYLALGSPEELAEQMMEECEHSIRDSAGHFRLTNILLAVALICVGIIAYMYWFSKGYTNIETKQYVYIANNESPRPTSNTIDYFD